MPIWAIDVDGLEPQVTSGQQSQANQLINNFQNTSASDSDYYSLMDKTKFVSDLRSKVKDPRKMFQRNTPLCGAALSCLSMAEFDMVGYVQIAIDLYVTGKSNYNNLSLESSTAQMLAAGGYSGQLSPVDFVMFSAIKRKGNVISDYVPGGYDNKLFSKSETEILDGFDGFTYPNEIKNRLTEYGLDVKMTMAPFKSFNKEKVFTKTIAKWTTLLQADGEVGLLIDSQTWFRGKSAHQSIPNHYVALRKVIKHPNSTYSIEVWSWGGKHTTVPLSAEDIQQSIFTSYEIKK